MSRNLLQLCKEGVRKTLSLIAVAVISYNVLVASPGDTQYLFWALCALGLSGVATWAFWEN